MRRGARLLFAFGALAATTVVLAAVALTLGANARTLGLNRFVPLARIDVLRDEVPIRTTSSALVGLDREAFHARARNGPVMVGAGRAVAGALPIFVVKTSGEVHAFIARDPRNGCRLELWPSSERSPVAWSFHDVCHGSMYDFSGKPISGPGPWHLDELVVRVRSGIVFAELHQVLPGRLAFPYR